MPAPTEISRDAIEATAERIAPYICTTPVHRWRSDALTRALGDDTSVFLKLELFQRTGTFKARGAFNVMLHLTDDERRRGVTAISAGNHAIATAYAAKILGVDAKVAMMQSANAMRIARCRAEGATLEMVADGKTGFAWCERVIAAEGRTMIHPFEGIYTSLATATIGAEMIEQIDSLDAVVIPVGGGGLASGMAAAVKLYRPSCAVYGVEPYGAATMTRSFEAGGPDAIDRVETIADSLGAPFTGELTYRLCREHFDDLVLISDDEMLDAQALLFNDLKLVVEPAGAASTAAAIGPLRDRLAGKRVGLIACGTNIDLASYTRLVGSRLTTPAEP